MIICDWISIEKINKRWPSELNTRNLPNAQILKLYGKCMLNWCKWKIDCSPITIYFNQLTLDFSLWFDASEGTFFNLRSVRRAWFHYIIVECYAVSRYICHAEMLWIHSFYFFICKTRISPSRIHKNRILQKRKEEEKEKKKIKQVSVNANTPQHSSWLWKFTIFDKVEPMS